MYHVLSAHQFSRSELYGLFELADRIRKIAKTKDGLDFLQSILSHKRAVLYFAQPSTRTYLSFNNACQILGIKTSDMRSAGYSSEVKGESIEDTLETMHSYTDMIIMRHVEENLAEKAALMFNNSEKPIPIINAGSGPHEHPTQALLDVYTLCRAFKGKVKNKTIAIIGDLKRGRAVRSLVYMLSNFDGIKFVFLSPEELKIPDDIRAYLLKEKINFEESDNLDKYIKKADVFYYTRIQDEYDKQHESKTIDYTTFYLKTALLLQMKPNAVILHPLPRRNEIPPEVDKDQRAWYWKQEVNGLWMRTALIAHIFKEDGYILNYK
ncbi:MAG TPA: aspartate carbamoyltransferase [Ignavibacteria bacterium]|nr:aspartate carbamoyltransferase [Ignavibacteria bacterium]HRF67058.1 aspartate carbamoyltransferase [Ignavibacteria bacterium]HRJ04991.1 aspartate carbamoyltransferase [Ignavibacteria bacterium]